MGDLCADIEVAAPENEEDGPALPHPRNRLLRPRRSFVVPIMLVIVLGIVVSLVAIGISRIEQIEPTPGAQAVSPTSLNQGDNSPVDPIDFPKPPASLVMDATRSYLASNKANAH